MPDTPDRPSVDNLFQQWLDIAQDEEAPNPHSFLAKQAEEVRAKLQRMIEDFDSLKAATGEDGLALVEGRQIDDYQLIRELGRGGMGAVWEAQQLSLKRPVALKLLRPQFSFSPSVRKRFQREAEAGGRLRHENIVQTFGVGRTDGVHWIAQELVPGGFTLADELNEQRHFEDLPDDWYRNMAKRFASLADALQVAHDAGVVHRDLKPGNILMAQDGRPKVADFGLAQVQEDYSLSQTGEFLGTPYYMSPEQAEPSNKPVDGRSDIFSLGSTLYEVLTLSRAFGGDTSQQVFHKILNEEPRDPCRVRSRVPRDLAVICTKCLEKSPSRRYASMGDLAADLRRHLNHQPILAHPPSLSSRGKKWIRRNPAITSVTSIVFFALSLIAFQSWNHSQERGRLYIWALESQQFLLDDALRTIGNLAGGGPFQEELVEATVESFTNILKEYPGDPKLRAGRARALVLLGRAQRERGATAEAEAKYQVACREYRALCSGSMVEPEWRHGLSLALVRLGDLKKELGLLSEAEGLYLEALGIDEYLVQTSPGNALFLDNLFWSQHRLGDFVMQQGDLESARNHFEALGSLAVTLEELAPNNSGTKLARIAIPKVWTALAIAQGDYPQARLHMLDAVEEAQRNEQSAEESPVAQSQLAWALHGLSSMELMVGEVDACLEHTDEAVRITSALITTEPQSIDFRYLHAVVSMRQLQVQAIVEAPDEFVEAAFEALTFVLEEAVGRQDLFLASMRLAQPAASGLRESGFPALSIKLVLIPMEAVKGLQEKPDEGEMEFAKLTNIALTSFAELEKLGLQDSQSVLGLRARFDSLNPDSIR